MKAIIFLNGDLSDMSHIVKHIDKDTLLIGCDGGASHIRTLGHTPDVIIGDFDSIGQDGLPHDIPPDGAPVIIKDVTYVRYPTDKDYTDSELAIKYAAQAGCWEVILAGSLGTRLDHLLGNIYLLNKPAFAKLKIKIIEGEQEAYLVRDAARIHGKKGDTISFMPFSGKPVAQTDGGLKYDLSKYQLSMQGNMGISNVLLRPVVNIEVTGGTLLVIHQL